MAEHQSRGERGRRLVRSARDAVTTVAGTLTGRTLEQQVTEYSEVYTQVLLGVHGDLEIQAKQIEGQAKEIAELKQQVASIGTPRRELEERQAESLAKEVAALRQQVASLGAIRIIAIADLAVRLLALGGALWAPL